MLVTFFTRHIVDFFLSMANIETGQPQHLLAISLFAGLSTLAMPCFAETGESAGRAEALSARWSYPQSSRECDGIRARLHGALPMAIEQLDQLLDDPRPHIGMAAVRDSAERAGDDFLLMAQAAFRRALSVLSSMECSPPAALRLTELIRSAVAGHPAVASRQAEQESALHGIGAARWQYAPSVTAVNDGYNGGVGRIEIQQPLWMGGALSAGVAQATAQHDGSRWAVLESQFNIAEQVIDAYGEWLTNTRRKASIKQSIDQLKRLYLRIQRREAAGLANVSEVTLAKARLSQASSDLGQTEAAIRAALSTIAKLVGRELSPDDLAEERAQEGHQELASLQERAQAYSPALKRAMAAVGVAEAEVDKKRAALSPQVQLVWQQGRGDYILDDAKGYTRTMVRVQFAPGAGASAFSNISGAKSHHRAAMLEIESIERSLAARVASLFEHHFAIADSLAAAESTLRSAQEVQASYERQFLAGRRGWLDVMNAVREVDDAQRNLGAMQATLLVLERKLALYSGTLLKEVAE